MWVALISVVLKYSLVVKSLDLNIGGSTELNYFDGGKMFFSCETLNTDGFARAIIVACSLHTLNMSKFCNINSTTQVELQVKEPE